MGVPAIMPIIGAPVACQDEVEDSWRTMAHWAAAKLNQQFGHAMAVVYFDLFDPACPEIPPNAQLPLVLIDNQVLSSGGKISLQLIRKRLQELGVEAQPHPSQVSLGPEMRKIAWGMSSQRVAAACGHRV